MKIGLISKTLLLFLILICLVACGTLSRFTRKGGTLFNVELKTDESHVEEVTDNAVKILQNRLNALGVDGEVRKTLPNRIEIKIYGDLDVQRLKEILLAESRFELRKVVTSPYPQPIQTFPSKEAATQSLGGTIPSNRKILSYAERADNDSAKQWIIVENPSIVDGRELRDASAYTETESNGNYQIIFTLTPAGAQKFGDWTGKNINNYLAIVLNDEVTSVPYIRGQIFDTGQIDGRFTKQSAEDLALIMKSGYLPATFQLIDEKKFD
jgi:preprotein translocase subunit SecD